MAESSVQNVESSSVTVRIRRLPVWVKGSLIVLPPLIFLVFFFLVPLLMVINFSIRTQEHFQVTNVLTADNFIHVLTTQTFRSSLLYSIRISLAATIITFIIGLPVAYYLAVKARDRHRNILLFLVIAPLWVNFFVRAYAIVMIASTRGIINIALVRLGLVKEPLGWLLFSEPSVIIGLSYVWLPLMVLPIYAILQQVETSWYDAARDLGAGPFRMHWEVTIPTALPGIILGALFVFLLSLGNQAVPKILGGAKKVTYPESIILQLEGSVNWPVAAAASVVLMAFVVLVLAGVFAIFDIEELF